MTLKFIISNLNINTVNKDFLIEYLSVFGLKILSLTLMFIISILLAKILGSKGIGDFYLAQSIINIVIVVSMFGLGNSLIKYSARSYSDSNWNQLEGYRKNSIWVITFFTTSMTLLVLLTSSSLSENLFNNNQLTTPLKWLCLTILPINILTVFVSLYKGMQKTIIATFLEGVGIPFIVLFLIILNNDSLVLIDVVKFYVFSSLILLLIAVLYWNKLYSIHPQSIAKNISKKKLIKDSFPFYSVALTNLVISVTDTIMLGFWEKSETSGQYGVALRIASISSIILIVVNTVVASKFAVFYKKKDLDGLSMLAKNTTRMMMIIAFLFLVFLLLSSEFLLGLFGKDFLATNSILIILALGQFFVLSTGPVAILLMMTGHE